MFILYSPARRSGNASSSQPVELALFAIRTFANGATGINVTGVRRVKGERLPAQDN